MSRPAWTATTHPLRKAAARRVEFTLADAAGVVDRSVARVAEAFPELDGFDTPAHWLLTAPRVRAVLQDPGGALLVGTDNARLLRYRFADCTTTSPKTAPQFSLSGQLVAPFELTVPDLLGQHRDQFLGKAAALAGKTRGGAGVFHLGSSISVD